MSRSTVVANLSPLRDLIGSVRGADRAYVKVGLLGSHRKERYDDDWNKEGIDNPSLGAVHEFGSASLNIPPRSFLKMPLAVHLPKEMSNIGRSVWRSIVETKGLGGALDRLGVLAVAVVEEAFRTGGFGRWAKLKAATIRRKKSSTILIDSGQLRRAVAHSVVLGK